MSALVGAFLLGSATYGAVELAVSGTNTVYYACLSSTGDTQSRRDDETHGDGLQSSFKSDFVELSRSYWPQVDQLVQDRRQTIGP